MFTHAFKLVAAEGLVYVAKCPVMYCKPRIGSFSIFCFFVQRSFRCCGGGSYSNIYHVWNDVVTERVNR
ncbi:hypothetical protein BpHYR1_029156 [Brachionus plicatilis]|uniref:Uncharacterized protein n=1 Tax=Brachionus plicatilis TaxID=10195 RepID=A0A3M7PIH6_BRAPC|nr:hypothetical protein BpHYR1_029156 [Brachionus plicatilis]